jgi:chitinase
LKELNDENNKQPKKYIVSFTAPTSFWYLRNFDLKAVNYVNFVNIMLYEYIMFAPYDFLNELELC